MKVIYSKNYIERDLYVIEYKGKYLMVYRSSGLNPGRKGRILPFNMLATPERATFSGEVPGYIYKEFYYSNFFINHMKDPAHYNRNIEDFLLELEAFLQDKIPPQINYDYIKTYKDVMQVAIAINKDLKEAISTLEPYDWSLI